MLLPCTTERNESQNAQAQVLHTLLFFTPSKALCEGAAVLGNHTLPRIAESGRVVLASLLVSPTACCCTSPVHAAATADC